MTLLSGAKLVDAKFQLQRRAVRLRYVSQGYPLSSCSCAAGRRHFAAEQR
jgi:hypothetical protein